MLLAVADKLNIAVAFLAVESYALDSALISGGVFDTLGNGVVVVQSGFQYLIAFHLEGFYHL